MLLLIALHVIAFSQDADPIDAFVPKGSRPQLALSGFKFLEGPAWTAEGRLIWSDILGDTVYVMRNGKAFPLIKPSHRAIGNTIDPQGRIVSCLQETRNVVRREKSGSTTVLADKFEGKRFNSPDDVIVRSDGTVYFTDPSFAIAAKDRELKVDGVYKISPTGKVSLLLDDFAKPNGLALSPDEKLLYVNDTVRRQIRVYDVLQNGDLTNDRLFTYITGEMAGAPNGMKVDNAGDVFCTAPGGIQIFSPKGKYLGVIFLEHVISNFCFGDADRKTLYITSGGSLYKLRLKVAGK